MMNKLISKTANKGILLSIILAVVIALSVVVSAIFGVSYAATLSDANTLTVTVNKTFYTTHEDDIKAVCEAEFTKQGISDSYNMTSLIGDNRELVYVFSAGEETQKKVNAAKTALQATFENKTDVQNGAWKDNIVFITVTSASETLLANWPCSYVVRASIAVAVIAVLAFAYTAIRYGLISGAVAGIATFVGGALSMAVILLTRIPVTNSTLYIAAIAAMITAVLTLLTLNKVRTGLQAEENQSAQELAINSVACKEILSFAVVAGVALVLVGAIATWSTRWFALAALIALIVTTAVAFFYVPAMYVLFKGAADKKALENATYGKQLAAKRAAKAAKNVEESVEQDAE
jgi:hypothetical protein